MANGLDLKKVIEIAGGPKKSALNDYIVISSKPVDARRYYSSYNLDSVLAGTLKVDLRENDEILIGDSLDLYPLDKVKIFGDVINQGEFEYGSNLSISKLLYLAGGFKKEALTTSILISRKIEDENKLSVVDKINSKRDFWNDDNLNEYLLKPGDIITVSKNPFYREQIYITLEGEFNFPGAYPISSRNQNLSEIIKKAGGINKYADVDGSYLIRIKSRTKLLDSKKNISDKILNELYQTDTINENRLIGNLDSTSYDTIVIGGYGNFNKIASAFILRSGDRVILPPIESTIKITGAVYNENILVYKENKSVSQYISLAGGLTERAKKNDIYLLYSNGMSAKSKNFLLFSIRPKLKPGCTIVIPYKEGKNNFSSTLSSAEKITLYSVVASTVSSILFMINQITL
jgi:protein involved in polysaccharide export with SLBB domain